MAKNKISLLLFLLLNISIVSALQIELLENTDECLVNCETTYLIKSGKEKATIDENTFWFEFANKEDTSPRHALQTQGLQDFEILYETQKSFTEEEIYCLNPDDDEDCIIQIRNRTVNYKGWEDLKKVQQININPYDELKIKIKATKKPSQNIDNIPVIYNPDTKNYDKYLQYIWWNTSWNNKTQINIPGTLPKDGLTLRLFVGIRQSLNCSQSNLGDLRVIWENTTIAEERPYFIYDNFGNASVILYFNATNKVGNHFVYCGNPSASTTQHGFTTFDIYDDFNDASINATKWTNSGSWTTISEHASGVLRLRRISGRTGAGDSQATGDFYQDLSTWPRYQATDNVLVIFQTENNIDDYRLRASCSGGCSGNRAIARNYVALNDTSIMREQYHNNNQSLNTLAGDIRHNITTQSLVANTQRLNQFRSVSLEEFIKFNTTRVDFYDWAANTSNSVLNTTSGGTRFLNVRAFSRATCSGSCNSNSDAYFNFDFMAISNTTSINLSLNLTQNITGPAAGSGINVTVEFDTPVQETTLNDFTVNYSFSSDVSNITDSDLFYNMTFFNHDLAEFGNTLGSNWSKFHYLNITAPIVPNNQTGLPFNFSFITELVNGTNQSNSTTTNTQVVTWVIYPRTVHFDTPIFESTNNNYSLNISKDFYPNGLSAIGILEYNNTNFSTTQVVNSTFYEDWERFLVTPLVSGPTNIPVKGWLNVSYQGVKTSRNSTPQTQQVFEINITAGSPCSTLPNFTAVLNFTFLDEFANGTSADMNGSSQITFWTSNKTQNKTRGFNFQNVDFHEICIQGTSFSLNSNYFVQYGSNSTGGNPFREFHRKHQFIDNITDNYFLYTLRPANATEIIVNVIDNLERRRPGVIVEAHKYNISNNSFRIVDTGQADFNGQVRLRLHAEDDYYKFVLKNGSGHVILETTTLFKLLFTEYFLRPVDPNFVGLGDIIQLRNIQHTLTYSNSTQIVRLTYNDVNNISGTRANCLQIRNNTNFNQTIISQQCSQNQTGTFTYNLAGTNGTFTAMYTVGTNSILIDSIGIITRALRQLGQEGFFLAFILVGTMAFAGIFISATASLWFASIGIIGTVWLGLLDVSFVALAAVLVAIGIIALFMNKEP